MRLGAAIYFVPFFIVLGPHLILHGHAATEILLSVPTAFIAVFLMAPALEGCLIITGAPGSAKRVFCLVAGILPCLGSWECDLAGIGIVTIMMATYFVRKRLSAKITQQKERRSYEVYIQSCWYNGKRP
jgi:TRAP-type uncharacterized transport system fused permease subunit